MNEFRLTKCSIDGEGDSVECYTDGTTWNGWDNVALTRKGIMEWLDSSPYDYHFFMNGEIPSIRIQFEEETIIESSPLWDGSEFVEAYFMDGYCFAVND